MGVDVSHLVFEASGNSNDKIVDDRLHSSEGCDVFSGAMMDFDGEDVFGGKFEANGKVG